MPGAADVERLGDVLETPAHTAHLLAPDRVGGSASVGRSRRHEGSTGEDAERQAGERLHAPRTYSRPGTLGNGTVTRSTRTLPDMVARSSYPAPYVEAARRRIAAAVDAYQDVSASVAKLGDPRDDDALAMLETAYFNNLLLALDASFSHRLRAKEGKDGNPLNEVRVLCRSIIENDDVVIEDKQARLTPEASVLGYRVGDPIVLSESDFTRLSAAYLDEIEARYAE